MPFARHAIMRRTAIVGARRLRFRSLFLLALSACSDGGSTAPSPDRMYPPASPIPPGSPVPRRPPSPAPTHVPTIHLARTDGTEIGPYIDGAEPAWSPDGRRLAYVSLGWVHVMNVDGSDVSAIAYGHSPAWSPDGTRIAYVHDQGITVVAFDGSGGRLLVPGGFRALPVDDMGVGEPAWSPDGTTLAFVHHGDFDGYEPSRLFVTPVERFEPRMLLGGASDSPALHAPAWSPDGTRLAAWSSRGLFTIGVDGGAPIELGVPGRDPAWSPDGSALLFVRSELGQGGTARSLLHLVPGNGGAPRLLIDDATDGAWLPDRTRISFVRIRKP